jgi:proteic killer suppression protein
MLIKPFADSETERVFHREFSRKLAGDIQALALRKLRMLSSAHAISDLRSPLGNCLEKLSGDRVGYYSIRVNDQYRICFMWDAGGAHGAEIVDYH